MFSGLCTVPGFGRCSTVEQSPTLSTVPGMRTVVASVLLALLVPMAPPARGHAAEPTPTVRAERKPMPHLKIRAVVRHLDHPWDVRSLPGGVLLFTQRDRATLSVFKKGQGAPGRLPQADRLGLRRDRTDGARGGPRLRRQPSDLHLPGRLHRRRRPRRPRHRLDPGQEAAQGQARPDPGGRLPDQLGPARWLPAPRHQRRVTAGRHRRRRRGHQPGEPRLARRQDAAPRPVHRRAVAGQPVHQRHRPAALRAHLRPPQRPGRRRARRRHAVERRAGHLPRRRGQPPRQRRRLRLQPGARLQRVGADDRPVAAGQAGEGPLALRQPDRSPRPGAASSTARSGAPSTARSRWPA